MWLTGRPPLPKVAVPYSPEGDKCAREKVTPGTKRSLQHPDPSNPSIQPSHSASLSRPVPVRLPKHAHTPPTPDPTCPRLPATLSRLGPWGQDVMWVRVCVQGRGVDGGCLLGCSGGTGGPFFPLFPTRTTGSDLPPGPPARDRRGDSCSLHHPPPLHTLSLSFLQMGARHEFSARPVPP